MAGAKASETEKQQILDLVKGGHTVPEIQERFPHIDGRILSGLHMRHTHRAPTPESSSISLPPPQPGVVPPPLPAPGPNPDPRADAVETTGFTPSAQTVHTPQGFKPGYREYFVVKKLDPPAEGVMKNEYPPFGIQELLERYAPGDYEVQHYREGRLFNTYREKIAPRASQPGFGQVAREPAKPASPADDFIKTMDVYHRIHTEGKQETAQLRSVETQARVEEVRAKSQVETAATVGLIDLVKELGKPKPNGNEGSIDRIFALMQEDRKSLELKMANELTVMRERSKGDLELERERTRADIAKAERESEERIKRERQFMEEMRKIDGERQTLWKESYDTMIGEIKGMSEAISRELEEKRKWLDQYSGMQVKHTDELIALKKNLSNGGDSLEMARIVKDGIVSGLDRVGARIDLLTEKGIIGKIQNPGDQTKIGNGTPAKKEEKTVLTKEAIEAAVKEPWFQNLQDEIARTVRKRKAATDPRFKPHGTLLGQTFIDQMNEDLSLRRYMFYLTSRDWPEVLVDAELGIKAEHKEVLHDPEATVWFSEFSSFLTLSWNNSIGVAK